MHWFGYYIKLYINYFTWEIKPENLFFNDQNGTVESKLANQKLTKVAWKVCNTLQVWWVTNLVIESSFVKKKIEKINILLSFVSNIVNLSIIVDFIQFVQVQVVML